MKLKPSRYIKESEANLLRFELNLSSSERSIKKALQRLCTHYEAGRRLYDPTSHRQLIHSHLWSSNVLHRRWSMKALGLIAHKDDAARLVGRLKVESDLEALTWGTAALLATSADRSMDELAAEAGLEKSAPFWLAARLYAPDRWLNRHWKKTTISLNDDDVTLKWAIFLAGYGRAPEDLFDPKHDNRIFLGKLNTHPSPEISEYSAWALWERDEYDFSDATVRPDDFHRYADNVRKWLYRLLMKTPRSGLVDRDMIQEFRMKDTSASAREGLALGLAEQMVPDLYGTLLDWFDAENDESVRQILLSTMATHTDGNEEFGGLVSRAFASVGVGDSLRRRLLVAAEGTSLYRVLMKKDLEEEFTKKGLFEFGLQPNVNIGEVRMGNTFNTGRDLNAQNIVGGDLHADTISAVQSVPVREDRELLEKVLSYLSAAQIPVKEKHEITQAVEAAAKSPSPETRNGVLSSLTALESVVGTVGGLTEIIEAVQNWLS